MDTLFDLDLLPTITRLTQITQNSTTLIDNILITEKLHKRFESTIILNDLSDHLPTLALLKQTKITDKLPLEFESRNLNEKKMSQIKHKLYNVN